MLPMHQAAASAFIREVAASGGRCLIHCWAGVNRSGVLACAELLLAERLPVLEVVARAKRARGTILWNESFQLQLVVLAEEHGLLGPRPEGTAKLKPQKAARKPAAAAFARLA